MTTSAPDFSAIKQRQQGMWAADDYARIESRLVVVSENLCGATDLRAGQRVLDARIPLIAAQGHSQGL